jgi:hypothetical protein
MPSAPSGGPAAAKPFVLERAEPIEIGVGIDVLQRIEIERARPFEPERAAGRRIEVPAHDLSNMRVEPLVRGADSGRVDISGGKDGV